MFDSLDEQMKKDEQVATTKSERMIRYAAIAVASVILFGGLYLGLQMMEGN